VGEEFPISFRFSQWKEVDYHARIAPTPRDLQTMLTILRAAGVDVFHAFARYFQAPEWEGSDLGLAGWAKSMTDAPVIAVGRVGLDTDVMDNFFGKEAKSTGEAGLSELLRRFNNREFDLISGWPQPHRRRGMGEQGARRPLIRGPHVHEEGRAGRS
jgi:hypothetical protein